MRPATKFADQALRLLVRQSTRHFAHLALLASLFVTAVLVVQGSRIEPASACRDCPFPMLVAEKHWRMPGGYSDVLIEEKNLGRGRVQSTVRLVAVATGELLAIGHLDHFKGARRLKVPMQDFVTGGELEANVVYVTPDHKKVRIKFSCQQCSLGSDYLQ